MNNFQKNTAKPPEGKADCREETPKTEVEMVKTRVEMVDRRVEMDKTRVEIVDRRVEMHKTRVEMDDRTHFVHDRPQFVDDRPEFAPDRSILSIIVLSLTSIVPNGKRDCNRNEINRPPATYRQGSTCINNN
jgi:hypothetical protein